MVKGSIDQEYQITLIYIHLAKTFTIHETETNRNKSRDRQNLSYSWKFRHSLSMINLTIIKK